MPPSGRKISAKELAEAIRSGLNTDSLMEKYSVSAQGLQRLVNQLLQRGLVSEEDLSILMNRSSKARGGGRTALDDPGAGASEKPPSSETNVPRDKLLPRARRFFSTRAGIIVVVVPIFWLSWGLITHVGVYLESQGSLPGWMMTLSASKSSGDFMALLFISLVIPFAVTVPVLIRLLRFRRKMASEKTEAIPSQSSSGQNGNPGGHGSQLPGKEDLSWKFGPYLAIAVVAYFLDPFIGVVLLLILLAYRNGIVSQALQFLRDANAEGGDGASATNDRAWRTVLARHLSDYLVGGRSLVSRLQQQGISEVLSPKTDAPPMSTFEKKFIVGTVALVIVMIIGLSFKPFGREEPDTTLARAQLFNQCMDRCKRSAYGQDYERCRDYCFNNYMR